MSDQASQEGVVLLHGLGRTYRCMNKLERALKAQGYATLNIDYPTRKYALADHASRLGPQVRDFAGGVARLHLAGFSMGGLVIRHLLSCSHRPHNLGRVVMLGTPNGGSEVADLLFRLRPVGGIFKHICGPVSRELTVAHQSTQNAVVDYPLGVVAGISQLDSLTAVIIKGDNDGMVAIEKTKLPGMADHVIVNGMHSFLPENKGVIGQAVHFIRHGRFMAVQHQSAD